MPFLPSPLYGIVRLFAVIMLAYILLPILFFAFASMNTLSFTDSFLESFPLGTEISAVVNRLAKHQSESLEDALVWFGETTTTSPIQVVLELSKLFILPVFIMALERYLRLLIISEKHTGVINHIANALFLLLAIAAGTLFSGWCFRLFNAACATLPPEIQTVMIFIVSTLCIVCGLFSLLRFNGFILAFTEAIWKMICAIYTYFVCCILSFVPANLTQSIILAISMMSVLLFLNFVLQRYLFGSELRKQPFA